MGYMGNYSRKLRGSAAGPVADGAGLLPNDKFAGRATPLKGKGAPPPDMNEAQFKAAKHFVDGTSFKDNDVLITSRPVTPEDTSFKPAKKFLPNASFKGNLTGTSAAVAAAEPSYRKSRSFSSAAPDRTLEATSTRLFGEGEVEAHRPCLKTTMPKPAGSEDVMKYRFSEGVSTKDYKMTNERMPAPTTRPVDMGKSTTSFMNASCDYSKNKYRGQGTAIVFG